MIHEVRNSGGSGRSCGWVEKSGPVTSGRRRIRRVVVQHDGGVRGRLGVGRRRQRSLATETERRRKKEAGVALKYRLNENRQRKDKSVVMI